MLLIPAIDLKDGQCVRLKQGLMDEATVFSNSPAEMAKQWLDQGAQRLHIVDLNGAFEGKLVNTKAISDICKIVDKRIILQLGGGIRNIQTIESLLDFGLDYVIIGTAAVTNPGFVKEACQLFPNQIMVGIDAKDGMVATDGWAKTSSLSVIELAKKFEDDGVISIVYTDISCDGMLSGISHASTLDLANHISLPVIASGGLKDLQDLKILCEQKHENILGVIAGRAIYEGTLDFAEAQKYMNANQN